MEHDDNFSVLLSNYLIFHLGSGRRTLCLFALTGTARYGRIFNDPNRPRLVVGLLMMDA